MDAEYKDLLYHTEVRWLSRGRELQRFVALKEEVLHFLKNEPKKLEKLKVNPGIMIYFSFLLSLLI